MKILQPFKGDFNLVESMERFQKDPSPAGKLRFFRELKAADLLVPCQGSAMNVAVIHTPEGENFLPAFTSEEELLHGAQCWSEASVLKLDDLKYMVIDQPKALSGIVINPFGKALPLRHAQLEEMDRATEPMTVKRTDYEKPQIYSVIRSVSPGLKRNIEKVLENWPGVSRAWLVAARKDYREEPHKLFIFEYAGDRRILFLSVAQAIKPFISKGESFELMLASEQLIKDIQGKGKLIYSRTLN